MSPHLTALRCLFILSLHHGVTLRPEEMARVSAEDPIGSALKMLLGRRLKGKVVKYRGDWEGFESLADQFPVLAIRKDGSWVVVVDCVPSHDGRRTPAVLDPRNEAAGVVMVERQAFLDEWSGTYIRLRRIYDIDDEKQPFGLRWFMPVVLKQAASFRAIALTAIMVNLIGYTTPLFFQVIIDKVISHQSTQTLLFVVVVFLVLVGFESLFSYVRQILMLNAINKIDSQLASRTFGHLISLPLQFFESTPTGVMMQHLQQTGKLRGFLTGRLFGLILDSIAVPVLLVLLISYSWKLTLLVICFTLLMALVAAAMVPTYTWQLNKLYQAEGAKSSHVVETLHGMRAVKSLVLETDRQKSWESKIGQSVQRLTVVGRVGAFGQVLSQGLEKLMSVSVLTLGALAVFDGSMTIGALVAFNMLSGRLTGPLNQVVTLITDYQETMLSVKMLGTVMNQKPERDEGNRHATPPITGDIEFNQVTFLYHGSVRPALHDVSFKIEEGQTIGVVGRSGSGKTTITRLIQAIHTAQGGSIHLNGVDIRQIDIHHLRRNTGVVLQENLLFRGTIRDNIAAAKPDAPLQEVLYAAQLAGAAEFIDRLPMSYDTFIEENGSNFSGGQRQRIAIARALITRPRLLIFDEATSALDPESESVVQANLKEIAKGRTLIIVSHRLASLVKSDLILVLEQGQLLDFAPHPVLLERCEIYRHLWQTQTQHMI